MVDSNFKILLKDVRKVIGYAREWAISSKLTFLKKQLPISENLQYVLFKKFIFFGRAIF